MIKQTVRAYIYDHIRKVWWVMPTAGRKPHRLTKGEVELFNKSTKIPKLTTYRAG